MRTTIKGNRGQTLGYINEEINRRTLFDNAGAMLGWYNENQDKTFDRQGNFVGFGDQLTRLLRD
jgi:hypothetical protein